MEAVRGEPKGSWESEVQKQQLCLSTQVQVHEVLLGSRGRDRGFCSLSYFPLILC